MKIFQIPIVLIWICVIDSVVTKPNSTKIFNSSKGSVRERAKRYTILYPWLPFNTAIALAVVLAIPLKLKGRNVYMSYNFETNFYMPYFDKKQGLVPLPWATIDAGAVNQGTKIYYENGGEVRKLDANEEVDDMIRPSDLESNNSTEKSKVVDDVKNFFKKTKKSKQKSKNNSLVNRKILTTLLSRKKLYKILEHKLDLAGLNGEECLLKTICETAELSFAEHNGVLGDILHIVFTPSSSRDERLPLRYYDATADGQSGRCQYYNTLCPVGIFDFISKIM